MEFGISTKVLRDYSLKEAISIAGAFGYGAIELWIDDLTSSGLTPNQIVELTDAYGLKRTVHLRTDDLNIASFNDGIRQESLKQQKEGIFLASQIRAKEATLHPGRKTSKTNSLEQAWLLQIDSIRALSETADEWGVSLCVEGMEKIAGEFILTPQDLTRVLKECKKETLGVTIDIAHLATIGDSVKLLNEAKSLPVWNVHISQTSLKTLHLPLFDEDGKIDYIEVFDCLKTFYSGAVIVEGYKKDMGKEIARRSIEWYKNIMRESAVK